VGGFLKACHRCIIKSKESVVGKDYEVLVGKSRIFCGDAKGYKKAIYRFIYVILISFYNEK
jgi:hypothetical protein